MPLLEKVCTYIVCTPGERGHFISSHIGRYLNEISIFGAGNFYSSFKLIHSIIKEPFTAFAYIHYSSLKKHIFRKWNRFDIKIAIIVQIITELIIRMTPTTYFLTESNLHSLKCLLPCKKLFHQKKLEKYVKTIDREQ